ncbi:MAG: hypothetical protein E6R08_01340 [Nevskiaceae bacterium]|nr:MAG: hypothetical protein E6R08_01340 [Nevskiaceae bacterium]
MKKYILALLAVVACGEGQSEAQLARCSHQIQLRDRGAGLGKFGRRYEVHRVKGECLGLPSSDVVVVATDDVARGQLYRDMFYFALVGDVAIPADIDKRPATD